MKMKRLSRLFKTGEKKVRMFIVTPIPSQSQHIFIDSTYYWSVSLFQGLGLWSYLKTVLNRPPTNIRHRWTDVLCKKFSLSNKTTVSIIVDKSTSSGTNEEMKSSPLATVTADIVESQCVDTLDRGGHHVRMNELHNDSRKGLVKSSSCIEHNERVHSSSVNGLYGNRIMDSEEAFNSFYCTLSEIIVDDDDDD